MKAFRVTSVIFHLERVLLHTPLAALKKAAGCPPAAGLPDFLKSRTRPEQRRLITALARSEREAPSAAWRPRPGARRLVGFIRRQGLTLGIVTHHGRAAVRNRAAAALGLPPGAFEPLLAREELLAAGAADPMRAAARGMRCRPEETLLVSADPGMIAAARAAGCLTLYLSPRPAATAAGPSADFSAAGLGRVERIIRLGLPLSAGKLPNKLLRELLDRIATADASLIVNPGVGEDIAAVDVSPEEVLVLKSDPITFATDAIGRYAVLVNANDIATAGATPRWLLTTLLFPPGSTASAVQALAVELQDVCSAWGITLCGGHTEITPAVRRPVVCGTMAGTVRRRDLIDKRRMRPGDQVLMTKAVAVEGTAIIAREFGRRLRSLGLAADELTACRELLDQISIIPEARVAATVAGTSAMHDVTEGGLATALEELSAAGGFGLRVHLDAVPILAETRRVCRLLGVRPLGLIGSGSLLITCRAASRGRLEKALGEAGVRSTRIGAVLDRRPGIEALRNGRAVRWISYEVDEVARLFARCAAS